MMIPSKADKNPPETTGPPSITEKAKSSLSSIVSFVKDIPSLLYTTITTGLNLVQRFITPPPVPDGFLVEPLPRIHSLLIVATGIATLALTVKTATVAEEKKKVVMSYGIAATTFSVSHFLLMIGAGHCGTSEWVVSVVLRAWVAVGLGFSLVGVLYSTVRRMDENKPIARSELPINPPAVKDIKAILG